MERLIRDQLEEHMTRNNFFSSEQHGFIKGKSCTTQLLEFLEDLTEILDEGKDVDVIYLDLCKAFDKVLDWLPSSNFCFYQKNMHKIF